MDNTTTNDLPSTHPKCWSCGRPLLPEYNWMCTVCTLPKVMYADFVRLGLSPARAQQEVDTLLAEAKEQQTHGSTDQD